MCFVFACCGWMIDLIQRAWTFTMAWCMCSAVYCVLLVASMSGIALGYNYSLAEYIDLKETNVSIYLKRGVFDDDVADDMDWRRSGRLPVAGQFRRDNLMTGVPEEDQSTTIRSGRRLDDSVFEADDQNKYEGSLMKLTAKPPFQDTPHPKVTDDIEMAESVSKYPMGSLDQMKAINSLIDSRRAMVTGATTNSPVATYGNINDRNLPYMPMYVDPNRIGPPPANNRRMMGPGEMANLNPARYAVPDPSIGSASNWLVPKRPDLFNMNAMPEYFVLSPTYPTPITLDAGLVRPTRPSPADPPPGVVMFATRTIITREPRTTKSAVLEKVEKDSEAFNAQFLLEGDMPSKDDFKLPKMGKSSEEEYEDEIKGLPVRKRRSMKLNALVGNTNNFMGSNIINTRDKHYLNGFTPHPVNSNSIKINEIPTTVKNTSVASNRTSNIKIVSNIENIGLKFNNQSNVKENNNSQLHTNRSKEGNTYEHISLNVKFKSDVEHKVETTREQNIQNLNDNKLEKTLFDRLITTMEAKKSTLMTETTQKANLFSTQKIKIRGKRKSFESVIVSSKYGTNNKTTKLFDEKQTTMSNQEILNSVSISLSEAGLLTRSSTFVKFLQSTLT